MLGRRASTRSSYHHLSCPTLVAADPKAKLCYDSSALSSWLVPSTATHHHFLPWPSSSSSSHHPPQLHLQLLLRFQLCYYKHWHPSRPFKVVHPIQHPSLQHHRPLRTVHRLPTFPLPTPHLHPRPIPQSRSIPQLSHPHHYILPLRLATIHPYLPSMHPRAHPPPTHIYPCIDPFNRYYRSRHQRYLPMCSIRYINC